MFELQPTNDNIVTVTRENIIGRNEDLLRFVEIINSINYDCSIALDGKWGSGKTFFLKQVKRIMQDNNSFLTATGGEEIFREIWFDYAQKRNIELVQHCINLKVIFLMDFYPNIWHNQRKTQGEYFYAIYCCYCYNT